MSEDTLTADIVRYVLANHDELNELRFLSADNYATALLLDVEKALSRANLTDRERLILNLRFTDHLRLDDISEITGTNKSGISRTIRRACRKIAEA